MPNKPTLSTLPIELQELIYKNLNLGTLLELRSTDRSLRNNVDSVVASRRYTIEELRLDTQLFQQAYKYFGYIEANADLCSDILDGCPANISSNELTQQIQIKMSELERIVAAHTSRTILENTLPTATQNSGSGLMIYRIDAYLTKSLMIIGCFLTAILHLMPGVMSLFKGNDDTFKFCLKLCCLAYLGYMVYDFFCRRYEDFTQTDMKFHDRIMELANKNMQALTIPKRDPHARMDYLWENSKKLLKLGIEQLEQPPSGLAMLLPSSTINVEQLKQQWLKK